MKANYTFVAATLGTRAKIYPFAPKTQSSEGNSYTLPMRTTDTRQSWEGAGGTIATHKVKAPITDKSYWENRYALCELTFRNMAGDTLVMNNAIVSVSQQKQIVSTQVTGRRGTVKEYIADGDYDISITVGIQPMADGYITDEYPIEALQELRKFLTDTNALSVHSSFLELWDITQIVVKSYSATQSTESNCQIVKIDAVSDEDYEIYSENGKR